ncbi:hypothetical protein [Kitasatospora sp. LaBMicrA B282]|uniref:hypothetical protein n=1 Tax=Kitasatospora sp. LaBMicrA B282 TaxID=3420949 RepID=UPI003D0CB722
MTKSYGPVQQKIISTLAKARTTEPYPVWMTWKGLATRVYNRARITSSDTSNVRRAARDMPGMIICYYYKGTDRPAGASLKLSAEESWLVDQLTALAPPLGWAVDYRNYRPPTAGEIREAFESGYRADAAIKADLSKVIKLVNNASKSTYDPSELVWSRLGLETCRAQKRKQELNRLGTAIRQHATDREHREAEARKITVGPYRVDPATVDSCPCCHQNLAGVELEQLWAAIPGARRNFSTSVDNAKNASPPAAVGAGV